MNPLSRIRVGLRFGLSAIAFGALMIACGSISVISADDAATGSGGTSGLGIGGGHGGLGGNPGSGGVVGSTGGTVGGGGSGTGGRGANGGGTGGRIGSGSGGFMGSGSGGFTGAGLGGTTGSGVGGSSGGGITCSDIQKAFLVAMIEAKTCVVGAPGNCLKPTPDRLDCGCTTFVNQTDRLDSIRASWVQNGCSTGVCTAIFCVSYKSAICAVPSSGGSASCQDQPGLPPPDPT